MSPYPPKTEVQAISDLVDINVDYGARSTYPARRSEHTKGVADLKATFTVLDQLPSEYRVGLFAAPGSYDAMVRFSNSAMMQDSKRDTHGMAMRVVGVPMETAPKGDDGRRMQDFIMLDSPIFVMGNLGKYIPFNAAFLEAKISLKGKLQLAWLLIKNLRYLPALLRLALNPANAPLSTNYWSTTPYKLGDLVVKYKVQPIGPNRPAPRIWGANGRRTALEKQLAWGPGLFSFGVLVQTNKTTQPLEKPQVDWEDHGARFVPLAEISIPSDQEVAAPPDIENELGFSPGHAAVEHFPLGAINRARVAIYAAAQEARRRAHDRHDNP